MYFISFCISNFIYIFIYFYIYILNYFQKNKMKEEIFWFGGDGEKRFYDKVLEIVYKNSKNENEKNNNNYIRR